MATTCAAQRARADCYPITVRFSKWPPTLSAFEVATAVRFCVAAEAIQIAA
jgi:hypothetical protein